MKRKLARTYVPDQPWLVELPGTEPGAEIGLTWAKYRIRVRETTRKYAK
jgi:hypothetical protein